MSAVEDNGKILDRFHIDSQVFFLKLGFSLCFYVTLHLYISI